MKKTYTIFILIFFAAFVQAFSQESKIVKIGWYSSKMFQEGMSDEEPKSGFTYEYLLKIADYNGWQFQYEYGNWTTLFAMLKDGKIDALAGVSTTEERKQYLLFPNFPMGNERYYLYQHSNDRSMDISDFKTFEHKKVGCIRNNLMTTYFLKWVEENNIHLDIEYYDGFAQRDSLFQARKLDGIVATDNNILSVKGYSAVVKVGEAPFYLAITKNRPDLLKDLNRSQEILQEMNPYFLQNLQYSSYGTIIANNSLTPEEGYWLAHHHVLNVGYLKNYMPLCDTDKDGKVVGLITDVLEESVRQLNLKGTLFIQYKPYNSNADLLQSLRDGTSDVIFPVGGSNWNIDHDGLNVTSPVLTTGTDLVYSGGFSKDKLNKIAINTNNDIQRYVIEENYPKAELILKNSIDECLKAVQKGEAYATTINGLRVNLVSNNPDYKNLSILQLGKTSARYIGVRKGETALLLLLNRGLKLIGRDFGINASYKYMDQLSYGTSDFIKDNLVIISSILLVIALLIGLILSIDATRAKKMAHKADVLNKKLEKAKKEAEAASNAKTTFLFNMSHDIRTPMNAIMGFTELLAKHQDDPKIRGDYLKKIIDSSNILLSIINNVLEMARIERGTINVEESTWSIEQFSDSLYSVFQEMMISKGIHFTRNINVQHNLVYCDTIKIREIFLNILSNAYKYTPEGGHVTMNITELPCRKTGWATFEITISDTGIGISGEFLPYIFDEFARENTSAGNRIEGTGLGLSIVKRLVELMNGSITVRSTKGLGSTFVVTLSHRIAIVDTTAHPEYERIPAIEFRDKRILLAEDNDLNAEITTAILSEAGFPVDRVADGVSCVNKIRKNDENTYSLVLMDIQMPGMNGYEATNAIRHLENKTKANIPILALTANAFKEDKKTAQDAGMNGHLSKPINVQELLITMEKLLKK